MFSILKKELHSFLSSIIGYVVLLAFLIACGFFLWVVESTSILDYGYATMDMFFEIAPWLLMLLIPAVTMRSFADEFRSGTIEWLMTKPLTHYQIILGKFWATLALVVIALIPTLCYVYTIADLSVAGHTIDYGGIIGSYIGLMFLAASFSAIGIFMSSLTNNQIVAFLTAMAACFVMYNGFEMIAGLPVFIGTADYYLSQVGMASHYKYISQGNIDSRDVLYFISVVTIFVAATRLSLSRRTWDNATQD